ncbi:symplekin [Teleopsis dalmanni]|uniref:symplekin n=1 Tax=Teleopsis dalmanni TaxID=139649 RepID=UPI0018CF740A|nr:symplekin [Teleopsis dalmanni]
MDGIIGRSQFLGDAANLFMNEETVNARSKIVSWLNELGTQTDSKIKCELLAKIQEIILGAGVELLDEFLDHILSLSQDSNVDVRKQVINFIEKACKVKINLLPQFINVIPLLLRDRSPHVIKRMIQVSGMIYKNGLQWICHNTEYSDSIEQAWNMLSLVKAQVLDFIDNDNEGVRTNAIKFLENVIVAQSYKDEDTQKREGDFSLEDIPENLKIIKHQKLEDEALNIFSIILQYHAATHISAVNLNTCTGSLCTIAKLRPCFMGPVIKAFKNLSANFPPTLSDSQINSVRKSLKMQALMLLKNRGSYEYQVILRQLLLDLGASQNEIQRSIPKMDKQEQQRRQKRILENATSSLSKRMRRIEEHENMDINKNASNQVEMEVDEEEVEKQRTKCIRVNEKFLAEQLRSVDTVVNLIIRFLPNIPGEVPEHFLNEYEPIRDMSTQLQVANISKAMALQMTAHKVGPGAAAFTKELPMRPVELQTQMESLAVNDNINESLDQPMSSVDEDQLRKEEATKKLRENMERLKGEQELIERMKQRAKTLKLQEITKPFSRSVKEKFLLDAVKRILYAERQCISGGVSAKRRKIVTVIAATFPDNVRYFIFEFIMMDIKQRIDLAFSWLYEEYCLLQGFTRHCYVKSENRPDYAYNELLSQIVERIITNCDFKDKILLLRRFFLEAPMLPDDALNKLIQMSFTEEYTNYSMELLKDLAIWRPPRKNKLINVLLGFCVHERVDVRERAMDQIIVLYQQHKVLPNRIEDFALQWISHLEKETPPASIFLTEYGRPEVEVAWKEETAKICLGVLLKLLPCNTKLFLKKLSEVFAITTQDLKRTILRSIDSAIKKLGPENQELLNLIEQCPKGVETLLIRMIYILTDRVYPINTELVRHARDMYSNKVKDARVLIPVLSGLTRQEILIALPKFLKLNQVVVREVFNRLLGIGAEYANQRVATTPPEILVALHTIDLSVCDLKSVLRGTSICLSEKDVYTQEVMIGVLQQLVEVVPLPTLLMRTIIQSLTLYPTLANFVLNLLQRLILKQVWRQKVIWEGFLKCIQRLKPQSLPVLLHLPAKQLVDALQQCPDLRVPLLEYAESIQDEPMSGITPQIMDIITGKTVDVFVTDETGGYITIDNIKKEKEEPDEPIAISTVSSFTLVQPARVGYSDPSQPLPPGED